MKKIPMDHSYHLELKNFGLVKKTTVLQSVPILYSEIDGTCSLWVEFYEVIRKATFKFFVRAQTYSNLKKLIQHPEYTFNYRIVIVNSDLFEEKISTELQQLIRNSNQKDGFCPADFEPTNVFGNVATNYLYQYLGESTYGYFEGFFSKAERVAGLSFCNPKNPLEEASPGTILLKSKIFSFCSWRFEANYAMENKNNFFVTIVLSLYDKVLNQFLDVKINVISLKWIEEHNKKQALTFLRYVIIVERFDIDIVMQYIYSTIKFATEIQGENRNWHGYAIANLSFGYEFPIAYVEIADDWGAEFAF